MATQPIPPDPPLRPITPPPPPVRPPVPPPPPAARSFVPASPPPPPPVAPLVTPPAPPATSSVAIPQNLSSDISKLDLASLADRRRQKRPGLIGKYFEIAKQRVIFAIQNWRSAPSWLVSLVIHVAIILILAAITVVDSVGQGISLTAIFQTGESDSLVSGEFDLSTDSADESLTSLETASEVVTPTELEPLDVATSSLIPTLEAPAIEQGLSGRSGAMRDALLSAYGGNGETEDAVTLGLKWLAKNQRVKGNWSLTGPYSKPAVNEDTTAATAMALLAFLGAGHTHQEGQYAQAVKKGVDYLLDQQQENGFLAKSSPSRQKMYAHAQATIALCELYGLTKDSRLHAPAEAAVKFCCEAQSASGGWRYEPREDQDLSVTGWYVMALMSARMAGIPVNQDVFYRIEDFLKSVERDGGALYSYQNYDTLPSISMTAEGLLCREYLGWSRDDQRLAIGADEILKRPINWKDGDRSVYYYYYATQTLHHIGGSKWRQWNDIMKVELPAHQVKSGKEVGSWDPSGDAFAAPGGRLYVTCLSIYCLEVYYRHLPIYGLEK